MANVKFEYNGQVSGGLNSWDRDSSKRVSVELDDNDLTVDEMLEEFMNFMKAIGYNFELGDHLEVVNDLRNEKKDDLNFDYNNYGSDPLPLKKNVEDKIVVGTSHPGYGAVPPQPIVDEGGTVIGVTSPKLDPY